MTLHLTHVRINLYQNVIVWETHDTPKTCLPFPELLKNFERQFLIEAEGQKKPANLMLKGYGCINLLEE